MNPDAEEECPQCSSKFLRSQGKFDPNNPKNLICATCFEAIHPSGGSTSPAVRSLKREKKVKTCPNCKTQTTSLWRKFKSADEVQRELEKKEGGKDREIDSSKPEFEGELGCNPCVLYWKLYGVSLKGSPDLSHFIFEINVGKSRIQDRTTLKLNFLTDSKSFEDDVI